MAELLALACAVLAVSTIVRADIGSVLLHEFIPTDSREDIELSATTPDGSMPAAIDTPSGVVSAPDTTRPPTQTEKAYGGSEGAQRSERVYTPDIDTRRPTVSRYDDPFSPSTTPYKRLRAFDTVLDDYTLGVADSAPRSMPIGGAALGHEDSFFGDLTVDLIPGEGVPIPTVGPGARLIKLVTVPAVGVSITADSADNWHARASVRTRVRLVQWLAVPRESFGGVLRDTPIHLLRGARPVPDHVRRSALEVAKTIGVSQLGTVRDTVGKMVAWFRSFEPSDDPPRGRDNKYLDLALSRKGVCRHRAYAFAVTAISLGIPTRMVVNEAHAWVEVFDGGLWRRIDLGGAATHIEQEASEPRPSHRAPEDPFPWPATADSGESTARRTRAERGMEAPAPSRMPATPGVGTAPGLTGAAPDRALGWSRVAILGSDPRVTRGSPLRLQGSVGSGAGPCAHVRVDVMLLDARASREVPIGSLSTDDAGRYEGAVVIPLEIPVGDYELVVSTPGDGSCGPGRSGS